MRLITRINRWYDDLDEDHPLLRMALFMVPMSLATWLLQCGRPWVWIALAIMLPMLVIRILPVIWKWNSG